jgi:hypothetical protein
MKCAPQWKRNEQNASTWKRKEIKERKRKKGKRAEIWHLEIYREPKTFFPNSSLLFFLMLEGNELAVVNT